MYNAFCDILGAENVLKNEPMSRHTTFRIGGDADFFLTPSNEADLAKLLEFIGKENIPYFILGNGSNILVGDKGFRGAVICPHKKMDTVLCRENEVYAECGAFLSKAASAAAKAELCGLEFASGIPGTVGGAVYMNAGAYGEEMSGVIKTVKYIDTDGKVLEVPANECGFGYRKSIFTDSGKVILSCTFELKHGNADEIKAKTADLTQRRVTKQPLDKPSAGSTFKRPEGHFAGGLIEQAGLKGYSIGGAAVSEKHAGFVINTGSATASDVIALIGYIKKTVYEKYGVMLEPEVKLIGEF